MKNVTLRKLLIARSFSTLADQLLLFSVPLLIYSHTGSISLSGLAFFIEWMPRVLSLPIAGTISDRFGAKTGYLYSEGIRTGVTVLAFIILMFCSAQFFIILSIMMGICAFFYAQSYIALEAIIPTIASTKKISQAQSFLQGIEQGGMILAPVIGGFAVLVIPAQYLIVVSSGLFLSSFLFMSSVHLPFEKTQKKSIGVFHQVKGDFVIAVNIIKNSKALLILILLSLLVNLTVGLAMATGAAFSTGYFGYSSTAFASLQLTTGIIACIGLFVLPMLMRKVNIFTLGIGSYLLIGATSLIIGVATNFTLYVIAYAACIALSEFFSIYIRTERVLMIPKAHMAKTIGVIVFMNQLSMPLSGLIVAFSSLFIVTKAFFIAVGIISIIMLVCTYAVLKFHSKALSHHIRAS
ncbi:MAG: MFS transporter [Francisellaceae bacterium]